MAYRVFSVTQVRDIWLRNGGADGYGMVWAVCVATAESGRNQFAVSPSGDYGLWQINESNFANLGINYQTVFDADVNARVAIRMSGNATNWAAWCTCWVDPSRDCGHGQLNPPQQGSPAEQEWSDVLGQLGVVLVEATGSPGSSEETSVLDAWDKFAHMLGPWGQSRYKGLIDTAAEVKGLVR